MFKNSNKRWSPVPLGSNMCLACDEQNWGEVTSYGFWTQVIRGDSLALWADSPWGPRHHTPREPRPHGEATCSGHSTSYSPNWKLASVFRHGSGEAWGWLSHSDCHRIRHPKRTLPELQRLWPSHCCCFSALGWGMFVMQPWRTEAGKPHLGQKRE